jgi:beta-lactamase regulating signal transducer with metallopeptidase domain
MPDGLWVILALIAVVVVYTIAKVRQYMRESDRQWDEVDKSKLREWDDDDDWDSD